jgi:23S rRNA (uracil1939-C5)-methyltransferase
MHLSETAQQRARIDILNDSLRRIGGVSELPPIEFLSAPASFHYRARARVAVVGGRVGFRERASHRVVDVERCAVLDPNTQLALTDLRARAPSGPTEVEIRGFAEKVQVGERMLRVGPGEFFQANRPFWGEWQRTVAEACGAGGCLVELYAGVGFYTVALLDRFERVVAVERSSAARSARLNTNAEVIAADANEWAPVRLAALAPDTLLLNPPRTGCDQRVLRAVRETLARRVVYVSCDPTTFARDVRQLASGYRVKRLVVIDALPQTHHVEVLGVFERVDR